MATPAQKDTAPIPNAKITTQSIWQYNTSLLPIFSQEIEGSYCPAPIPNTKIRTQPICQYNTSVLPILSQEEEKNNNLNEK